MTPRSGRVIAWLSFMLGIGVSIAGNIGHAASDGMKPGEWAGAAFWPLALMLTIEILTRIRWQVGWNWTTAKVAALVLVALVAAVLSYRHLAGLMTYWGEDWVNAHLGPLAVDGLMLIAATALLSISKERETFETFDRKHVFTWPQPIGPKPARLRLADPVDAEIQQLLTVVETSRSVPPDAAEDAAFQAWMNAPTGQKPSVRRLADLFGLSPSKTHRLITSWRELESVR